MAWPTSAGFDKTVLDATSDLVHLARPEIYDLMADVENMIAAAGIAEGVAELGADGYIPTAQLPVVPISKGGTGATSAEQARYNLGLTPFDPGASEETLGPTTITHASTLELLVLESAADNADEIILRANRYRPAGVDADDIFAINVYANDDGGDPSWLSSIKTVMEDSGAGSVDASMLFSTKHAGVMAGRLELDGDTVRVLGKMAGGSSGASGTPATDELLWGGTLSVLSGSGATNTITDGSGVSDNTALLTLGLFSTGASTQRSVGLSFSTPRVGWFGGVARIISGNETATNSPLTYLAFHTRDNTTGNPTNEKMRLTGLGSLGIGTGSTVSAKLHAVATTEQLRLGYDGSNYTSFTTSSGGDLTIAPTGGDTHITGNLRVTRASVGQPTTEGYAGTTFRQVFPIGYRTTDATPIDITLASGLSNGDNYRIQVDIGYADDGAPPSNYGGLIRSYLAGKRSGSTSIIQTNEVVATKVGDAAIEAALVVSSGNLVLRLTGKASTNIDFGGDVELIKKG